MGFGVGLTVIAVLVLLVAEWRGWTSVKAVAKPLASTGFLVVALAAGGLASRYGMLVVVGLVGSWVGDVALLSSRSRWFLTGLVAFAGAHVMYAAAFVTFGVDVTWTLVGAAGLGVPATVVYRWLRPHVPGKMVQPVQAYVVIISVMVACAIGAFAHGAGARVLVGAIAFYVSDLAVARQRFVRQDVVNRLWGLPLYYGAQLLLASSTALRDVA